MPPEIPLVRPKILTIIEDRGGNLRLSPCKLPVYHHGMCAKQSLRQSVREATLAVSTDGVMPRLAPGNTIESGYPNWRLSPRGSSRSPVRNDAGRNAKPRGSSVKVSSPVKRAVLEWSSYYADAKTTPEGDTEGAPGVQGHGMYRRLLQELGRSLWVDSWLSSGLLQDVMFKWSALPRREVRWFRSSEEVE
jgi:hypothetical protein